MGAEKKNLFEYIEATETARQSGDKNALRQALQEQQKAFQNVIDSKDTSPQSKSSLGRDVKEIQKELSTLPQRSRSSPSAAPPKPTKLDVPTLPAATSKWKSVKEKSAGVLNSAFKTLKEIQNQSAGLKSEGKQSPAPSKPLPSKPTTPSRR